MLQKAKFIQIVKRYPILYDMSHEDYKNSNKKERIWEAIGRQFNESGDDLKKKWKSLKDTYAKYLKRTNHETHGRKWIWAEEMKVFFPYFSQTNKGAYEGAFENTCGSDEPNASEDNKPIYIDTSNEFLSEDGNDDNDYHEENSEIYINEASLSPKPELSTIKPESTLNLYQPKSLKRKCDSEEPIIKQEPVKENPFSETFSDIECLLLAHARTIGKFSPGRQAVTKFKIAEVIMEQELLHAQEMSSQVSAVKRQRHQSEDSLINYGN